VFAPPRQSSFLPIAWIAAFSLAVSLVAADPINTFRIPNDAIAIDGRGMDLAWSLAERRDDFRQRLPFEGQPASRTQVSVVYDDNAIYVLVDAYDDNPESIIGRRTRRDESSTSDWIHVWLATNDRDDRYAYRFSVNAGAVKQDARLLDGTTEDLTYNAVWDAAVTVNARGWTAEFRIPFHQLGYTSNAHFRFQVVRDQARTGEQSTLFPYPRAAAWPVQYMQPLEGLPTQRSPVHAELVPYLTMGFTHPGFRVTPEFRAGGDLKLTLSPEVTLQATILPDFGQIESDPSELNLSVYETFLTERRPFFLDGGETLDFGLRQGATTDKLFYSRRIGQPPRVDPGVQSDNVLDYPKQTTILAATKLTARSSEGYTIGILQATTEEAFATITDNAQTKQVKVAPLSQYFIARGTKLLGDGRTSFGAAATTVNRELGAALANELPKNATTAGLDLEHRSDDVRLTAKVFASRIEGTPSAILKLQQNSVHYFQRPDAHHIDYRLNRTDLDGFGATLVGNKFSGEPWRASWGGTVISPGFDPNDLGFLQRADDINAFAYLQYLSNQPSRLLRSYWLDANAWANFTFGGETTSRAIALSANLVTRNTSTARLQIQRDGERLDPRVLRGDAAMRIPGKFSATLTATTDDRKAIALDISTWGGRNDGNVAYWVGGQANVRIRPVSFVQLALGPYVQHAFDGFSYVTRTDQGEVIIARMPRDTVSLTLRGSIALSNNLSLQLYTMPYFSAGRRYGFAEVVDPKSSSFSDHFRAVTYSGDRLFWFGQVRTNAVLRWEYVPGSAAFVVWSREQSSTLSNRGSLDFGRDVDTLASAPSTDVILVKWAHWLSY